MTMHWCEVCEPHPERLSVLSFGGCPKCNRQMRMDAPPKRTEESVREELTRAVDAQQDEPQVVELTWQFIKANPTAPFDQARATVEAFIVWRDSRRKQLDARVEELHKEWRSFKDAA